MDRGVARGGQRRRTFPIVGCANFLLIAKKHQIAPLMAFSQKNVEYFSGEEHPLPDLLQYGGTVLNSSYTKFFVAFACTP